LVKLTSNSSTGTTSTIGLSGTGVDSSSYEVSLTWNPPGESTDPVAGYYIYRAISGSSTYQLLNSSLDETTAYNDASVNRGTSYIYYVESVDGEGIHSAPSNRYTVSIP
jgi:fibronectin type 3 domain-containing protein